MFEKWYKLTGISKELFDSWKDDLRQDILWWEEAGEVQMRIKLPVWKALRMKKQIEEFNLLHENCILGLEKVV